MNVIDRIDNTLDGRCPCGANPAPGSPYCGDDCTPTHHGPDTDTRMEGNLATAMRWRPDLVTNTDDSNLTPVTAFGDRHGCYTGRHDAQVFQYTDRPSTWHLRLDNGHRYVGLNITEDEVYGAPSLTALLLDMWARLERELDNTRHLEPGDDPRAGIEWVDIGDITDSTFEMRVTARVSWRHLFTSLPILPPPGTRSILRNLTVT